MGVPGPDRRARQALAELHRLLGRFGADAAGRKSALLATLAGARVQNRGQAQRLQRIVCFLSAFPDDAAVLRGARRLAAGFHARVRRLAAGERARLDDSGTAGTVTRHVYGAAAARWLARRFAAVAIDWAAVDAAALAALLERLWHPLEGEAIEWTTRDLREWLRRARGNHPGSALAWLLAQAPAGAAALPWQRAYDAAEVPLAWPLGDERATITRNRLATAIVFRPQGMRRASPDARGAVTEPLESIRLLERRAAARLLEVWRAALWSRTRTVLHIERPNLNECLLADFGGGLQMAAVGIEIAARGVLEASFGYLLLANGVPIGYGGFTPLFAQVNTGTNVFPEYRGSEAAFAFQQALRTMHALTGCALVLINPYQFGAGNDEALASGAFWFYYRLGFRPARRDVRALAGREFARLGARRGYRVPIATLRQLATCDLHLELASDAGACHFDEALLPALARGLTAALAREPAANRATASRQLAQRLAGKLGFDLTRWSSVERRGFERFAPLLAQIDDLPSWPASERKALAQLARARWAPQERDYVNRLRAHDRLRLALARAAARATPPAA